MAQIVEFESSTGSTLTSKLFAVGSDTAVATASSVTEGANRKGVFSASFTGVANGVYRLLSTESSVPDSSWWVEITSSDGTFVAYTLAKSSVSPIGPSCPVQRSLDDDKPITFAWPVSGATITGTVSLDNGSYAAVQGAIAFLRTEDGKHFYTLAFDADDRPTEEGTARYKFVDGTYTRYVVLQTVVQSSGGGGGSVTVDADAVVNALLAQGPTLYTALTADETILRIADEYVQEFAGLGDLSGRDNIAFALKTRKTDADTAALIYLTEDGGLTRVNGAAYVTTANGSITVDDEVAGDITVRISSAVTAGLTVGKRQDAVKILITGGNDITKRQGLTNVIDGTVAALG